MKQFNVGNPLEQCALDVLGPLPVSNNARYLLFIPCYFTNLLMVIPSESTDAKTVAAKLIEKLISDFGVPGTLHIDLGSLFESIVFQ